jgi:hypothetical protein
MGSASGRHPAGRSCRRRYVRGAVGVRPWDRNWSYIAFDEFRLTLDVEWLQRSLITAKLASSDIFSDAMTVGQSWWKTAHQSSAGSVSSTDIFIPADLTAQKTVAAGFIRRTVFCRLGRRQCRLRSASHDILRGSAEASPQGACSTCPNVVLSHRYRHCDHSAG